ncbi:hypothetical protein LINPERPRIM_LOCUS39450 [Linum perenne]
MKQLRTAASTVTAYLRKHVSLQIYGSFIGTLISNQRGFWRNRGMITEHPNLSTYHLGREEGRVQGWDLRCK